MLFTTMFMLPDQTTGKESVAGPVVSWTPWLGLAHVESLDWDWAGQTPWA